MKSIVYTVGHSNHEIAAFLELLRRQGIAAIGDVRSQPYSRYVPQYSQGPLKAALIEAGIAYLFLGDKLGARSDNPACYEHGKVQFDRLAQEPGFLEGIAQVIDHKDRQCLALLCAEKDPIECHRGLLVARKLHESGVAVSHILADGTLETHEALETRLLKLCKLPPGDMFTSREDFLADAYTLQGHRIAYRDEAQTPTEEGSAVA
jgi:uncharacterized protein (DUF488 family)